MTFEEMKYKYDKFNAFHDFTTVEEAEQCDLLPRDYHGVFPQYCSCGSEMIINYARTRITCCDPRCSVKQGLALSELFKRFNYKGIADATCADVYSMLLNVHREKLETTGKGIFISNSYVEILALPVDVYPKYFTQSAIGLEFLNGIHYIKQQTLTFSQMVSLLGLPEFDSTAYKLFNDINSAEELIKIIKSEGGVANFCDRRGVYALQKKYWLQASLDDIVIGSYVFEDKMKMQSLQTLEICITGSLQLNGVRVTKNDFVAICNDKGISKPLSELLCSVFDEYKIVTLEQLQQISKLLNGNIIPQGEQKAEYTAEEVVKNIKALNFPGIPVINTRMTTAKKSVPYIIADYPSNSAKYLEGLRRGEEYDSTGRKHKVLVNSSELLDIITNEVLNWEEELMNKCKKSIIEDSTKMQIF